MSPAGPGEAWQEVAVHFYAGGRADETPREIFWQGAWRPVALLAEDRVVFAGGDAADARPGRQFRLALPDGARVVLRGLGGAWQAKNLTAFGPGC